MNVNNRGKQNFSLGAEYMQLLTMISGEEERPKTVVLRRALREYIERHYHDLALEHQDLLLP